MICLLYRIIDHIFLVFLDFAFYFSFFSIFFAISFLSFWKNPFLYGPQNIMCHYQMILIKISCPQNNVLPTELYWMSLMIIMRRKRTVFSMVMAMMMMMLLVVKKVFWSHEMLYLSKLLSWLLLQYAFLGHLTKHRRYCSFVNVVDETFLPKTTGC